MMTEDSYGLMIPFGQRPDGIMVGAEEPTLANGLACNCVCPKCNARLVARNRGEVKRPHFAHEASGDRTDIESSCANAAETSIHLMAKQIIAAYGFGIKLPPVVAVNKTGRTRTLHNTDLYHRFSYVRLEAWFDGFRPDIVGTYSGHYQDGLSRPFALIGQDVAIEIRVTHPCDQNKIAKLREYGLASFEIDLSASDYSLTEDSLRLAINRSPRQWLYHKLIDEAILKMDRDEDQPVNIIDPVRAQRAADEWWEVVRQVRAQAESEGRIVYVTSERET